MAIPSNNNNSFTRTENSTTETYLKTHLTFGGMLSHFEPLQYLPFQPTWIDAQSLFLTCILAIYYYFFYEFGVPPNNFHSVTTVDQ